MSEEVEKGGFCKKTLVHGTFEYAEMLVETSLCSGCTPTSLEHLTQPPSPGHVLPSTGSVHHHAEPGVSFQRGRRKQTLTYIKSYFWDWLHTQGLPTLSGNHAVRYLPL